MEQNGKSQIDQILNLVKIASLAFPAIAFFQYNSRNYPFINHNILLIVVLASILILHTVWSILQRKLLTKTVIKAWVDSVCSISIAFLSVLLTGSYTSSYKFLFMFVIITSSIECSMKTGITVASISAAIVLSIDLIFAPKAPVNIYFESDLILACVFLVISWTIGYYVDLRKKYIDNLKNLANMDGLTKLYNHRYFHDALTEKLNKGRIEGGNLSLLFIDIDNFKHYNDLFGHQKGDQVLIQIANLMRQNIRSASSDSIIARYGGEEFTILLPGVDEQNAIIIAERLRKIIQDYPFEGQESLPGNNLTISVGVSSFPSKAKTEYELIRGADDACYKAKFLNKNRVEAYYSILEELQKDADESEREIIASIKTLIAVINAKDKYTYRHVERVVFYCSMIADSLDLVGEDKKNLVYAAYLHDIGKINIPEEILNKPEKLTAEEWHMLTKHPQNAVEIIKNIRTLKGAIPIILQHHERYDGTGYPFGLKGEEITFLARLLTVVDCFDAMTSLRPYQQRKSYARALEELHRCSGTQFDPEAVRVFIDAFQGMIKKQAI